MKRLLPGLLVFMGFLTSLSCSKPSEPAGYILATDMAYGSIQDKPNPDSSDRAEMEALSSKSDPENEYGADSKAAFVACCCPCPARAETTAVSVKSAKDTTHCPCPSLMEAKIVAPAKGMEFIKVDGTEMEASDPPAGDSLKNAKIYQLPGTAKLPDGTHELVIKGNLTGSGVREYTLMIETIDGKLYKKNAKE